ncbi:MAG TPA: hypothetical protein VKH45_15585 [Candidatus Acidoferrum sp.]|nr:hypothetical protein [Candidatus Acidoferrum sp.]
MADSNALIGQIISHFTASWSDWAGAGGVWCIKPKTLGSTAT